VCVCGGGAYKERERSRERGQEGGGIAVCHQDRAYNGRARAVYVYVYGTGPSIVASVRDGSSGERLGGGGEGWGGKAVEYYNGLRVLSRSLYYSIVLDVVHLFRKRSIAMR